MQEPTSACHPSCPLGPRAARPLAAVPATERAGRPRTLRRYPNRQNRGAQQRAIQAAGGPPAVPGRGSACGGEVFETAGDEERPALETGAEAAAGFAVEVLVEHHVRSEMRVRREQRIVTVERTAAAAVGQEESGQPPRQV